MAYVGGGVFGGTGCEVLVAIKLGDLEANIMVETQLREARSFISLTLRMVANHPRWANRLPWATWNSTSMDPLIATRLADKTTSPNMIVVLPSQPCTQTHTRTQTRRCHYVMCVFDT